MAPQIQTAPGPNSYPVGGNSGDLLVDFGSLRVLVWDAGSNGWQAIGSNDPIKEGGIAIPKFEYLQDTQNQVAAASYAVTHPIFVAPNTGETWQVVNVSASFSVAGGASCAVTAEVCTGTAAPGAGTAQLTATIPLTGTANTAVNGTLIASPTTINAGNRVGLVFSGTVTALAGCVVVVVLKRIS